MVELTNRFPYGYFGSHCNSTWSKTSSEQMRLIAELDEKYRSLVLGMIETMLTKKKFKDFFQKNGAAL